MFTKLGAHIGGDLVHGGIIALGPGHHGLGDGDDVLVPQGKAVALGRRQHAVHHDLGDVVPLPNDGGPDAPGYSTD